MSSLVGHTDTITAIDYASGTSPLLVSSSVDCTFDPTLLRAVLIELSQSLCSWLRASHYG